MAGSLDSKALMAKVKEGGAMAMLKTVNREELAVMQKGNMLWVKGAKGAAAR